MTDRTRPRARFCGKSCYNRWYRANGKARPPLEKQREYAHAYYARERTKRIEALGSRFCVECGAAFPAESRSRRKFCSRYCTNQCRLREKPEQARAAYHRYRAHKRANDIRVVTERDWRRLLDRYDGRCAHCGCAGKMTQDHIIPISRGGRHAIGNLLPACRSCNSRKGNCLLAHLRYRMR